MTNCQDMMGPKLIESLLITPITCWPSGTSTWRTACTCGAGRSSCATPRGASSSGSTSPTTWCLATLQVSLVKGSSTICG